ncbi:MAG: low specificity L-threonine aldolase [Pseudomonadota bacterium]
MNLGSDTTSPAHPRVMEALMRANSGAAVPYGNDPISHEALERVRDFFEAPEAEVFLVPSGSAANGLSLSALVQPWQNVYCSAIAHIHSDECGAPEFFTNGARMVLVPEEHGKITPADLEAAITEGFERGLHYTQPGAVALTQVTERGTVYTLDELHALTAIARTHGLPVHLDGARFANAMVALGCTAAEMSWKAGIDVVSFGGTKNGLLGVEAVVVFDPALASSVIYRQKRAGLLFSKQRYLSAQMAEYLTGSLCRDLATAANGAMARLAAGIRKLPDAVIHHPVDANIMFVSLPRAVHRAALADGPAYFMAPEELEAGPDSELIPTRLVTNWATTDADIDRLLALMSGPETPVSPAPQEQHA